MEDFVVQLLILIALFVGVVGAVLPVLPGAPLSILVLLIAKIAGFTTLPWWVLLVFGLLTTLGLLLDYLIPLITTKKLGGSRYGVIGMLLGLVLGIFFSPFGFFTILVLPFLGAVFGELLHDRANPKKAVIVGMGSLVGYMLSSGYGLVLCLAMFFTFMIKDVIF